MLLQNTRGPAAAINEVLHTQDDLDEYLASCQSQEKPKHAVQFPEERAVAVALGVRPTGGYQVEIIAVVQETGGFVGVQNHVLYVEKVPHGIANDMVTYPQHVIRARGMSGIVTFREVPDGIGHSLHALTVAMNGATPPAAHGVGDAGHATTLTVGEETHFTSFFVGEEGPPPTTQAVGEEGHLTSFFVGEEGPPPTTQAVGEEAHFTSFVVGEEHGPTTLVGEHPTTLGVGEEGISHGGWRGPFG